MAQKSMLTGLQLGGLFTDTSLGWASKCPIVSDGETIYSVPFQIPKVINVIYQVLSKPGWCFQFVWKLGDFMSRLEEPGLPFWSPTVEPPIYSGGKRQHFLWDSFPHWNSQFSQTPRCEGKRRPTSSSMRSSRQCWSLLVQLYGFPNRCRKLLDPFASYACNILHLYFKQGSQCPVSCLKLWKLCSGHRNPSVFMVFCSLTSAPVLTGSKVSTCVSLPL